ncbi:CAZyme family GH55 [Paecilomyces variotii]|nr:CAZyme family GH55 [Paecilomyces variotii]KAJ9405612.1 CAZyme family GH55 [Paecilomyces variotii]
MVGPKQILCLSALFLNTLAAALPLSQGADASARFPSIITDDPPFDIWNETTGISFFNSTNFTLGIGAGDGPANNPAQSASCSSLTAGSSQFWYEAITHNGESSYLTAADKASYSVFRNVVTSFGADNTGAKDASAAIQNAINAGVSGAFDRTTNSTGTTTKPAIVYLPSGTYLMQASIQLFVGTVIVGDPINPPVLKASSNFPDDHIVYGKDPNLGGTVNFYIGIKNIVIDSTAVEPSQSLALLDWTVSQATQITNVMFNMPLGSTGHTGLTTDYGYNSNTILGDLTFYGGNIGLDLSGQQWVFKGITFNGTKTAVIAGATNIVFQGCTFNGVNIGINASSTSGSLTVIDSTGIVSDTLISSYSSGSATNSIVLDNVQNVGNTVTLGGSVVLSGSVTDTWVHGDLYTSGDSYQQYESGQTVNTPRPSALVSSGDYFTMKPPTYQEYAVDQFVNIKTVTDYPVYGDGYTDDTENINAILQQYAGCKIIYFPAGTYIVTDTVLVPKGSRIFGDAYASAISASGANFANALTPTAMVQVGEPDDVGVAQISDMMFTVSDVLSGCKMVEVNIAGSNPGDVGFWNSHFRVGGAKGTTIEDVCLNDPDTCKAAWGMMHLTNTSSAYLENMWGWTADHDLDGNNNQTIATGRGILVEATKGTWLVGTAFEHNTLYQYNFNNASNVFSSMQQSETPYWQGPGSEYAPAPWAGSLIASDPDFSNCATDDALCRMAFFELIQGSSELFLYGGCVWAFFNDNGNCNASNGDCQTNAISTQSSSALYLYSTNVKSITNIVLDNYTPIATEAENTGGWGGVVAAYLYST